MSDNNQPGRSSLYLVQRAEALLAVLRFFQTPGDADRPLQFLAQSDFWEWEVDNLIYSFTQFAERSRTWQSPAAAVERLGRLGIAVSAKVVRGVRFRGDWQVRKDTRRVAPLDLLRETIGAWNQLIDLVEARFVVPMRGPAERYGIQTPKDLNHLRKSMPAIESAG